MTEPVLIRKNARESVHVGWASFEGRRYVDVRVYFVGDDGDLHPSRKGIALRRDLIPEVIDALQKAYEGEPE